MTVTPFPHKHSEWIDQCIMGDGKNPRPLPNLANALTALKNDPGLRDAVAYDEMLCAPMLLHAIGDSLSNTGVRPLTDKDVADIQDYMQHAGLKRIGRDDVRHAVEFMRSTIRTTRCATISLGCSGTDSRASTCGP